MSAQERILDGGDASEAARTMLHAALGEKPSEEALQRTILAMSAAGGPGAAAASGSGAGAGWLRSSALKWIGLASIAVAVVVTGWLAWRGGREPTAPSGPAPVVAAPAPAPSAETLDPPTDTLPPAPVPPPAADTPRAATASAVATASTAKPADSLAAQIAALDAARGLLAAGDANGCIAALDRLQRDYPRTPLAQEAAVLRIEALAASGRRVQARALATRFLAAHPDSPYATRLRTLTGEGNSP